MCNFKYTSKHALFLMIKEIFSTSTRLLNLNNVTSAKRNLLATMPKALVVICNAFDERFQLLYEDMEVRNATFASNKIMQNMCITFSSQVWGIDYITSQPTVLKLCK